MSNGNGGATGEAVLALAAAHIGQSYVLGQLVPKNRVDWAGPWDCSEFCSWLVYQTTGKLYGCAFDTADPATAKAFTGYWRDDAYKLGKVISIEDARRTPGAFLLRVPTTIGHIVVSDGKGGTVEAMGRAWGVRRGPVSGRVWDFGILVPWITYNGVQPQPGQAEESPPSEQVVVLRRTRSEIADARVEALQRALIAAGFDPGPFDGQFGPLTERAVFAYQDAKGLVVDGQVGPETGRALRLKYWKGDVALPDFARPAQPQPVDVPVADWPQETRSVNTSIRFDDIASEYLRFWQTMAIRSDRRDQVKQMATRIAAGQGRYQKVADQFPGLPWYVVGILHAMECACNFKEHLHNGDPLSARTVHAPANRPPIWDPATMTWEDSAQDAIRVDGFDKVGSWPLPRMLYMFEQYNGFGPRKRFGKATAYLWSFSNHYVRGKYVADGKWDPEAISDQAGASVLLWQLIDDKKITAPSIA